MRQNTRFSARQIAFAGVLGAITIVLGSTPIGFIQIPPVSITIMHIPTIIAGVLQGPVIGGAVGAMFGAFSMWQAQTSVNPMDKLIFSNPLIAVVPRILVGVVAYYVFRLVRGDPGKWHWWRLPGSFSGSPVYFPESLAPLLRYALAIAAGGLAAALIYVIQKRSGHGPALAAAAGSLTNTVLVLGLIAAFGFYRQRWPGV